MLKELVALKKAVFILNGDLTLRVLLPDQVSDCYVSWMNDYEVTNILSRGSKKLRALKLNHY